MINTKHLRASMRDWRLATRNAVLILLLIANGSVMAIRGPHMLTDMLSLKFPASQAMAAETPEHLVPRLTVYVASPLGFTESTRLFMTNALIPAIQTTGMITRNPWDTPPQTQAQIDAAKNISSLDVRRLAWEAIIQKLGAANAQAITNSDGVVAVLDGADVDSGTAAEIGYATALGKWVIGYRSDFRRTGEDQAAEVNLQVEYFIRSSGGVIVHTLDKLKDELNKRNNKSQR